MKARHIFYTQQLHASKRQVVSHQEGGFQDVAAAPPWAHSPGCTAIRLWPQALPLGLQLALIVLALPLSTSQACFCL